MLSGVPNFAYAIGYTTSSWTLKIGLLCEHFCRLLAHPTTTATPSATPRSATPTRRPARCWTSPPATSNAPSTSCPAKATKHPG
jgi:cation diffusion facilitator CzcD-associated flavoprotein CzcO